MRLSQRFAVLAGCALLGSMLVPGAVAAQATRDQARLVLTVSPGYMFGGDLWRVDGQPLVQPHVSHLRQVPLRTRVKFPHSRQCSPS